MTVRIAKQPVNLRERLSELERPIGLNGSALMRTETPQEAFNIISAGRKNLIINGGMNVWQRGTSFLDPASGAYTADRWKNSTNPTDISRSTDVPSGEPFTYSMLMAANGSGGTRHAALQGVELPATGSAGPFKVGTTWTFSCWLKGGASGSIFFGIDFRDDPNSGTNAVAVGSTNFNYTTSWQKFTYTFTVGASPGGTNLCLAIILYAGTAPANNLYITGCQLEQGKVATPFEYRSYGEELALCQRYCYVIRGDAPAASTGAVSVGHGVWNGTEGAYILVRHPVLMRDTPTLDYGNLGWYRVVAEAVAWKGISTLSIQGDGSSTNSTTLYAGVGTNNSDSRGFGARMTTQTTAATFILSAEL
jgi:hypothetical protein